MVLDGSAQGVARVRRHRPVGIAAQELVGPVAGDPAGGGVCVHDALVLIYEDHGVERGLEGAGSLGQGPVKPHSGPPLPRWVVDIAIPGGDTGAWGRLSTP